MQRCAEAAARARVDLVITALVCILSSFSASILMRGFCADTSNSSNEHVVIPVNSVLHAFPCAGTPSARARFLARHILAVNFDLLRLRGPHVWVSVSQVFWLLRLLCALALPHRLHTVVAAPMLTYATRAAPLLTFLAAGSKASGLGPVNAHFLFAVNPAGDAFLSLTQPTTHALCEAAFNVFSLTAAGLLTSWHGWRYPEYLSQVYQQLLIRLALIIAVNLLNSRRVRAQRSSSRDNSNFCGGGAAGADLAVAALAKADLAVAALAEALALIGGKGLSSGAAGAASHLPSHAAAVASVAATAAVCDRSAPRYIRAKLPDTMPHQQQDGKPVVAAASAASAADCLYFPGDGVCGAPAAALPASEAAPLVAMAAATVKEMMRPPPPYRSAARRRTTRIKIPFAEPDQITPGFVQRLQAMAAERGIMLSGVYVREGCIELVLDEESWDIAAALAVGGGDGPADAAVERLLAELAERLAATDGDGDDTWAVSSNPKASDGEWDVAKVLAALQLAAVEGGAEQQQEEGQQEKAFRPEEVTQHQLLLGQAAAVSTGTDSAYDLHAAHVLEIRPRVLLLPAAPVDTSADSGTGIAIASAPATAPTAKLLVLVAAEAPLDAPLPEVLVRCRGAYLAARVARVSSAAARTAARAAAGSDSGGGRGGRGRRSSRVPSLGLGLDREQRRELLAAAVYEVELLEMPRAPGAVMVELRWGGRLGRAVPVLLLPAADVAVAAELQAAAATVYDACNDEPHSCALSDSQLDDLFFDIGTWIAAFSTAAACAASAASTGNDSDIGGVGKAAGAGRWPPVMPRQLAAALGGGLLRYATAGGLHATAARVRIDLEAMLAALGAATGAAAPTSHTGCATHGAATGAADALPTAAVEPAAPLATVTASPPPAVAVARSATRPAGSLALSSLALAAGWRRGSSDEEEAAYRAYSAPLVFAQGHVIQAVEALSLVALLFRARHDLLSPGNLTSLAGCAVGTLTTLGWVLLPYHAWVKLVNVTKIPRYVFYLIAKVMIGWLGFPAPPGIVAYQLGPAMLVMEGLLLPGSCLLPTRTALVITLLKWPLAIGMAMGSGAAADVAAAAMLTGRVVLLAMTTTVACHAYLRYCFGGRMVKEGRVGGGGGMRGVAGGVVIGDGGWAGPGPMKKDKCV